MTLFFLTSVLSLTNSGATLTPCSVWNQAAWVSTPDSSLQTIYSLPRFPSVNGGDTNAHLMESLQRLNGNVCRTLELAPGTTGGAREVLGGAFVAVTE